MLEDLYGNSVSSDDPVTVAGLNRFIVEVLRYGSGAASILETARNAPECGIANAYAATLMMFMEDASAPAAARPFLNAAKLASTTAREQRYIRAVEGWVEGRFDAVSSSIGELIAHDPRDLFALKLGQTMCLLLGDFTGMLNLSSACLAAAPEVGYVHGMHAFALEQSHRIDDAETEALRAVAIHREDPWAHHAYAHVQETRGCLDEGIRFMRAHADTWANCNSFMLTHNWWHVALFHIDRDEPQEALSLYDSRVWGVWKAYSQDQLGAISLLARLELRGVDVGGRWAELAAHLQSRVEETVWPFNDLHYLYGLARAGEHRAAATKLARFETDAAKVDAYLRRTWQEVAVPTARGMCAAGLGRHAEAVDHLKPVMARLQEIGGSHAQRDLFEQIFIDALERAGERDFARALVLRRIAGRRDVAWQHRLRARLH